MKKMNIRPPCQPDIQTAWEGSSGQGEKTDRGEEGGWGAKVLILAVSVDGVAILYGST